MHIDMSLCAVLRGRAGSCQGDIEVADGATLAEAVQATGLSEELPVIACVNGRPAPATTPLAEGDRVYLFLPVSGG